MTTIKTQSNDLIVVEVPYDAKDFIIKNYMDTCTIYSGIDTKNNIIRFDEIIDCKILGKLSELEDKDLEKFCEKHPNIDYKDYMVTALSKAVNGWTVNWVLSPKQSFISLLQSNEIDTSKNLLIIEVL